MRDKDKFWAFALLLLAVLGIAGVSLLIDATAKNGQQIDPQVLTAKLQILNMAMGGLIAALGAAAQALFRLSAADADNAKATRDTAAAARTTAETAAVVAANNNGTNGNGSEADTRVDLAPGKT